MRPMPAWHRYCVFAQDTSLFSVVQFITKSTNKLNNNFKKISNLVHQWKMYFNFDHSKRAHEFTFSQKIPKLNHLPVIFNNKSVILVAFKNIKICTLIKN